MQIDHALTSDQQAGALPGRAFETRLSFGALLVFAALLPVQTSVRISLFGFASVAVFPGDVALAVSALAFTVALLRGSARLRFGSVGVALVMFLLLTLPSVAASSSPKVSVVKWATAVVYVGSALLAANVVDSEAALMKTLAAWNIGTAITVVIGLMTIVLFYLGAAPDLVTRLTSNFGSLPAGHYPRVAALFYQSQPNSLCHYLSISLLVVCASATVGILRRGLAVALGLGVLVVVAFTFSLGLGATAFGIGWWLAWNPTLALTPGVRRTALVAGLLIAVLFAILTVVAPASNPHRVGGMPLFSFEARPSARVVCWEASWAQFLEHPIVGRGVGLQATCADYVIPTGLTVRMADAHSLYFSIASTMGILGLAGFAGIVWTLLYQALPPPREVTAVSIIAGTLTIAFVQAWLVQGFAASFQYTRDGWLLVGLLGAALRLGNARREARSPRDPSTDT